MILARVLVYRPVVLRVKNEIKNTKVNNTGTTSHKYCAPEPSSFCPKNWKLLETEARRRRDCFLQARTPVRDCKKTRQHHVIQKDSPDEHYRLSLDWIMLSQSLVSMAHSYASGWGEALWGDGLAQEHQGWNPDPSIRSPTSLAQSHFTAQ